MNELASEFSRRRRAANVKNNLLSVTLMQNAFICPQSKDILLELTKFDDLIVTNCR